MKVSMLILASGRGSRFGGDVPKVYCRCAGATVLEHAVRRLAAVTADREMILAVHPEDRARFVEPRRAALREAGIDRIVDGGDTRQASMRAALAASDATTPLVLVHDAARPLVPIAATRAALDRTAAVAGTVLAIPAVDTLKQVDDQGRILKTLDRRDVWRAQTPQVMQRDKLAAALALAERDGFDGTDDVSLLEHAGFTVEVVPGAATNVKITRRDDLALVEALLARREDPPGNPPETPPENRP